MFKPNSFPGQKPDEKIYLFLRRHWLAFLPSMAVTLFLILIPLFIFLGLRAFNINIGEFKNLIFLATSSYLLIVLAFFLTSFIDYYLDIYIITSQRILDIEQNGLFNRVISGQNISRVQDVTAKKKGILQTFFDYGDVFIQTAGEAPNFEFLTVAKPNEVAQEILKYYHDILSKGYTEPERKPPLSQEELKKGGEVNL